MFHLCDLFSKLKCYALSLSLSLMCARAHTKALSRARPHSSVCVLSTDVNLWTSPAKSSAIDVRSVGRKGSWSPETGNAPRQSSNPPHFYFLVSFRSKTYHLVTHWTWLSCSGAILWTSGETRFVLSATALVPKPKKGELSLKTTYWGGRWRLRRTTLLSLETMSVKSREEDDDILSLE